MTEAMTVSMTAYLRTWLSVTAGLLLLVAGVNYGVDPYGRYRDYGAGEPKPHAGDQAQVVKPARVLAARPRTLILGNSRAEVGLDPASPAWPAEAGPVYNLALPGTGLRTSRRLLEHVLARHRPQTLVLGVDYMDFLVRPDEQWGEPDLGRRLLVGPDGDPNSLAWLAHLQDGAATLASLDALLHSLDTLRQRGSVEAPSLTMAGFNPMADYRALARNEGFHALFRQKDVEGMQVYRNKPRNLHRAGGPASPALDDLGAMLDRCQKEGIRVVLVIYPYHAHLLEIFRLTGHWALFEAWKGELVDLLASHHPRAELWDFSGYHAWATETVPPAGDKGTPMAWYWEAGHFQSALGERMITRWSGGHDEGFGVLLSRANLAGHLALIRRQGEAYRAGHGQEVQTLENLAAN